MKQMCLVGLLAVCALDVKVGAQEVPSMTPQRRKAVNELISACIKAGAVRIEGKGARAVIRFDQKKVQAVVAARGEPLAELVDALVAYWGRAFPSYRPLLVSLLHACGDEKKDERTRGLAAFLGAKGDESRVKAAARGYEQAARHFAAAREPGWQAVSLNNLGAMLKYQAEYEQALKHFRHALQLFQTLYPREQYRHGHPHLVSALNNLATVLGEQGEHEEALKQARQALQMSQSLYPKEQYKHGHFHLASSLESVGLALQAQGEYEEAQKHYRQALQMAQALYPKEQYRHGHPLLANSFCSLGRLLQAQKEHREALQHHRQALLLREELYPREQFKHGHPNVANSLNDVGLALQSLGEYAEALKYHRQALHIVQNLYPREQYRYGHPHLASTLNNVGSVLKDQGEYEEALKHFRLALRMLQALYPREKYRHGHPFLTASLTNVAGVLHCQGKHNEALKHLRQALAMRQQEVERLASSAPEDRSLNFAASLPLTRDVFLSCASQVKSSTVSAYTAIWSTRSAISRVHEHRQLALLASAGSPKVRSLYDRLRSLRQQRARLLLAPLPPDTRARDRRLQTLSQEIEKTEEDLLPLLPALARSAHLARSTPAQLQEALSRVKGKKTAFVDLLRYAHFHQEPTVKGKKGERYTARYTALVLTSDQLEWVDLGEAKPIEETLELWRKALSEGSEAAPVHARRMRERTWDKLAKALVGIDTVYLAPDARLTQLPWAALPGDRPGTVLLEQLSVAVVPHGIFLLDRLTAPNPEAGGKAVLLAVGGVKYDDRPTEVNRTLLTALAKLDRAAAASVRKGLKWGYLSGTAKELEHVKGLAGGLTVRTLIGTDASTQRLLVELPRANLVHLATHGFFADVRFRSVLQLDETLFDRASFAQTDHVRRIGAGARSPLVLSGLVLAGANRADTPDRGILSADDLTRLDLRKLDLAVLSACETGLGEVGGGEGVFGLQRAFHVAGTRNVIASLWKVDDEATAALMVLFYRFLWEEKLPPLLALRKAQLALYHNPGKLKAWSVGGRGINLKEVYTGAGKPPADVKPTGKAHPKLWAAFTLSGLGR